jgi:lactate dehydrogenase-like 2-hydroxyacid dehydrogenase
MTRSHVLVARPIPAPAREYAAELFDAHLADHNFSPDEVVEYLTRTGARGLLMGGNLTIDSTMMARLPDTLEVIATTSVGVDHIDVGGAKSRGIAVTNVPDVGLECTADLAMMHILAASRRAHEYDSLMRRGWGKRLGFDEMLGWRVSGKRLGIVGMGRIGRLVAQRARGFDMNIRYHDVAPVAEHLAQSATYHASLDSMLPQVDIVTLHMPSLPSTHQILNAHRIALLPKGAIVVNAARGTLIDYEALIHALQSGHIAAAGLDTFPDEPRLDQRLVDCENVFLTPHIGSATVEARIAVCRRTLDNIKGVLDGTGAINPV